MIDLYKRADQCGIATQVHFLDRGKPPEVKTGGVWNQKRGFRAPGPFVPHKAAVADVAVPDAHGEGVLEQGFAQVVAVPEHPAVAHKKG